MSQLSATAIAAALTTRRLGRPTIFLPSIGSTNDVAHEQAAAGAGDGLLVVADEQTAGRGRSDHSWWAPPRACLLMSLLLRPTLALVRAGQLTMCLGLAAAEAIEQVTGLRAMLKWPNDLLLHGRKLGGMLTELRAAGDRLDYVVLGLGINVNVAFDAVEDVAGAERPAGNQVDSSSVLRPPSDLLNTATSLQMVLGRPVDRLALLAAILARTEAWYEQVLAGDSPHAAWAGRLDTLGRRVSVVSPCGMLVGQALNVTPEGGLVLRDDAGREHVIWSGDITAVRPV